MKNLFYQNLEEIEILGFLNNDLNDLCISRPKSRLSWGIELPFDKDYVTYVWFDALINYINRIGYSDNEEKFNYYWPANYHLMAKDILTRIVFIGLQCLCHVIFPCQKQILLMVGG